MVPYQIVLMLTNYLVGLLFPLISFMQNGWTALKRASFNGHHKVVELLLRAGANPDLQSEVRMGVYPVKQGAILNNYINFVAVQIDWST